jgi:hypothetical protein
MRIETIRCLNSYILKGNIMKGNIMKNDTNVEVDLIEEQLQEITGGCAQCTADRAQILGSRSTAAQHLEYANDAIQHVNQSLNHEDKIFFENIANNHLNDANDELKMAHLLTGEIAARGHM